MFRELALAAALVAAVAVGMGLLDAQQSEIRDIAIQQANTACDASLPGDGWSAMNGTVNASTEDVQQVLCTRNGTVEPVKVDIEVTLG